MTRQFFAGGSYVDALPTGEFCVLFLGSHIQTHLGPIPLPPNETGPLFLRCTNVGGFKFAGQAHDSNGGYEWVDGRWRAFGPPVCGINPVIYDRLGILHVSDCSMGTQGFRYVEDDGTPEGKIHSGDETYGSPFGLSEWSAYGGLFGGQGHDGGGCRIYDGSVLRELESGDCRFVHFEGAGQTAAISYVKPDGAVIVIASLAELRAIPKVGMVVPPPPPPPPPPPVDPTKEPPVSIPDLSAVFASAVNARPDLLAQYRAIAVEGNAKGWPQDVQDKHVAIRQVLVRIGAFAVFQQNHDFGLLRKEDGAHGTRPSDGARHALQILVYKPTMQLIQVLSDTDPEWAPLDPHDTRPAEFWIQPLPEGAVLPPNPPPLDPPPPVTDPPESDSLVAVILARVDLLETRMNAEFAIQRAANNDTVRSLVAIAASLEALKARESGSPSAVKFPSYAGTIRLSGAVKLDPVVPK